MASFCSSNDQRNFQWITVACVDLIKLPLRDILASYIKPVDLFLKIKSCSTLKLRPEQRKVCLIQPPGIPDYNTFDVTLLYTLIRNLCGLPCPVQGWGKEPKTTDIHISDDIERLRLFRNNYYAHAMSASVPDIEFEGMWRNLKLAITRIACNSNIICNMDYANALREIERLQCTEHQLEAYKIVLEAYLYEGLQNQTDSEDEPDISIIGENETKCGETALFEANVEKVKSSSWTIAWYKRRGDVIKCIDTREEKYSGSTKRKLVIKSVCKEDEGEYQAVLSFESNGPDYKSKNTIRLYVFGDVPSVKIFVNSPVCFGSKTIIKSEVSSTTTPEKIEWQKSKDGIHFHCIKEPILFRTTGRFECPSYVIPKTTFTDKLYYRILVWNENGEGVSNTVYLDVTGNPPNIMTSFNTNIKDRSVKLIGNLYVYDDSPGILETFWTKNEKKINPDKSGGKLSEISNENPSLTISNVSPDDAGEYRLTATNAVGSSTSDVIVLGNPIIFLEKIEDKKNERHSITVMIESLPAPYHVQWSAKNKDDEHYTPIDVNTEEYKGTTVSFPHPVLVVTQKDQLGKNCFKIEVTNFIGKTVHEISGENNPVVFRTTDNVKETPYNDHEASVRFTSLNSILADEFPFEKVEKLKFLLKTSDKVKNRRSVLEAKSAMDCLTILQDEKLFTQTDVILMQFLCRETNCLKLNDKCIEYAEKHKALCFFEKQSVNGCVDVQFHVQGDISGYTKEFIRDVIETVADIVDCKEEDIHLNAVRYSKSFFLSISIKKVYIRKLLALKEQDRLSLKRLNIDFLKIDKETIYLNIEEEREFTEEEKKATFIIAISSDSELSSHSNSDDDVSNSEKEGIERKKPSKKNLKKAEERGKNVKQRPTTEKDTVEPEKKKRKIKDKAKSTCMTLLRPTKAHLFSKGPQNQKDVLPSIVRAEVSKSVGLIHIDTKAMGTGFRVGEKFIVTCAHVIENAITAVPYFIDGNRVHIEFGRILYNKKEDPLQIFDLIDIAYLDKEYDFAILELGTHSSGVPFPPALTCFGKVCCSDVHLVGHPNCRQMMEDSVIPYWLPENSDKILPQIEKWGDWSKGFFPDGKDYYKELKDLPRKIMFHTTFNHGSSGSPGFIIRDEKPFVVLMVRGGIPTCVYDNTFPSHAALVQDNQKVEYGYALWDIYEKMANSAQQNVKYLASKIFEKWMC